MATTTNPESHWEEPVPTAALDGAVEDYSRDKTYVVIFLILFAITVVEVVTYFATEFILFKDPWLVPTLLVLAAVKFWIVAGWFMHLRFDRKVLKWLFYSGLILAILVYVAVLTMFRIWWPDSHAICESVPNYPGRPPAASTPGTTC